MKKKRLKKNGNGNEGKAVGATIGVFALSLLLLYFSSLLIPRRGMPFMSDFTMNVITFQAILSTVNILLVVYLFYIYAKDYFELRAAFTGGLLLFLMAFLLFALTSNPLVHLWFGVHGGMGVTSVIPMVFSSIALFVLAKISTQ
ncbi:hypothetical protein KJ765_00440 [Candidatus Micrarchaeota archaeon]|nr:hypothetical protein [Candidatus Micrarchaeota archaeon]